MSTPNVPAQERLTGRRAIVTGGARGIGRTIALTLAARGAAVAVVDLDDVGVRATAEAVRAAGGAAWASALDVSDSEAVRETLGRASAELGPIDILVNNAAITTNVAPLLKLTPASWNREVQVNLCGPFYCAQAVLPGMVERRWGRIVNLSSTIARMGVAHGSAYAASKAGVLGLTKSIALEFAHKGITCNAVLPGFIASEMVLTQTPEAYRERVRATIPGRALGEPVDIANAVAFLASDAADYVNGAEIVVSGGLELFTF